MNEPLNPEPKFEEYVSANIAVGASPEIVQLHRAKAVQAGLKELDRYNGNIDGVLGKSTLAVLHELIPEEEIYTPGGQLNEQAVSRIDALVNDKRMNAAKQAGTIDALRKRFTGLGNARDHVEEALKLDPQFKGSIELRNSLAGAHAVALYILSEHAIDLGSDLILEAAQLYDAILGGLNTAASSRYVTVSEMWAKIEPKVEGAAKTLVPTQDKLLEFQLMLETYKFGDANDFKDALLTYIQVSRSAPNKFLKPTGNLVEYRAVGPSIISSYTEAVQNIIAKRPKKEQIEEDMENFGRAVSDFELYKHPETETLVRANWKLFEA